MIAVYCPRPSDGARALVQWLRAQGQEARRIRNERLLTVLGERDTVVVWGQRLQLPLTAKVLNAKAPLGKFRELEVLAIQGIPVPEFRRNRPTTGTWLARLYGHAQGLDLLAEREYGDYYVRRETIHHEFRFHVFKGKGFRTGVKAPIPGRLRVHPFVRTHPAGWYLSYRQDDLNAAGPRENARRQAVEAVKTLEYDFGAVDVGVRPDGTPVVFEVNSAPGLEGGTIDRYGQKILAYSRGELND